MGEISKEAVEEPKREPFVKCPTNTQQLFKTLGGHIFSSVAQIQMFQNERNALFAGAQLQKKNLFKQNNLKGESPCLKINSYGMKLLKACWGWQRIFCAFVHHEFSHKHVIEADLISRLEEKRIFLKLIMAKKYPQGGRNSKVKIISLYPRCQNSRTFLISSIILCRQKVLFYIWHFLKILNRYRVPTIPRGQ